MLERFRPYQFLKSIGLDSKARFQRHDANVPLFSDLFIPAPFVCPGCQESHWMGVCSTCLDQIKRCEKILESPIEGIEGVAPLFYSYTPAHSLLTHWKDHAGKQVEQKLFQINPALEAELKTIDFDFILPVPQSLKRNWERGHASALQTAHYFSKWLKCPIRHSLKLNEEVKAQKQASLNQWERFFSASPFVFQEPYSTLNRNILLVDDLITSGATLLKASEAIREQVPHARIWAGCLGYRPKRVSETIAATR